MSEVLTTKKERDIMRHALGITGGGSSYRNYFCTGPGSSDYDACQELVAKGLMTVRKHPFCADNLYYVTDAGKTEVSAEGRE